MQASYLRHVQLHADVLAHAPNVQHMQKTGHVKTTFEELFPFINPLCNILQRFKISFLLLTEITMLHFMQNVFYHKIYSPKMIIQIFQTIR